MHKIRSDAVKAAYCVVKSGNGEDISSLNLEHDVMYSENSALDRSTSGHASWDTKDDTLTPTCSTLEGRNMWHWGPSDHPWEAHSPSAVYFMARN
jgi:hypothetical protein